MKRVTITVEEGLLEAARAELLTELEDMTAERPYSWDTVAWVAEAIGRPADWVASRLGMEHREDWRAGRVPS